MLFWAEEILTSSEGAGRPRHRRVAYRDGHPKSKSCLRVLRSLDHNNLPNFINAKFLRNDEPKTYDLYCASMLMLLKPWQVLHTDLKGQNESWPSALSTFLASASSEVHNMISGIQYLHASSDRDKNTSSMESGDVNFTEDDFDDDSLVSHSAVSSDEALATIIRTQTSVPEEIHGRMAIELAKRSGIFAEQQGELNDSWTITGKHKEICNAIDRDLQNLAVWKKQLEAEAKRVNEKTRCHSDVTDTGHVGLLGTEALHVDSSWACEVTMMDGQDSSKGLPLTAIDPSYLNVEQR